MTDQDLLAYFSHHTPKGDQLGRCEEVRRAAFTFAKVLLQNTPEGADQTYAIRLLRQAVQTANQSIALESYEASKNVVQFRRRETPPTNNPDDLPPQGA